MTAAVGVMQMPADFKYKDVFLKGRPRHDITDPFFAKHPKMDPGRRAKIFAPFDALRGFGEEVASKSVLYVDRVEPEEADGEELSRRLNILRDLTHNSRAARKNRIRVSVTFYEPCADSLSKSYGIRGRYKTVSGICMNVDAAATNTIRVGDAIIPLENVTGIEADEIFRTEDFI